MSYSKKQYERQIAFFNANITKTKTKPTIVAMADALRTMFINHTLIDIKGTLVAAINVFDKIDSENYGSYMQSGRAICSNLAKIFENNYGYLSKPSKLITSTISVVSYFFYKSGKFNDLVIHNDRMDVYLVEYPIPSNVEFYTIDNYWQGEQGTMRIDYIKWLNRHFKLILIELEKVNIS